MELNNNALLSLDGRLYQYNPQTDMYEEVTSEVSHDDENEGQLPFVSTQANKEINKPEQCSIKKNVWDRPQTQLLLQKIETRKEDLNNPRFRKTDIYKDIATELEDEGYHFTPEQVNNRIKTLITKYKAVKDHNSKSGNDRKTFEYYEALEKFFGDRAGITSVASCSSISLINAEPAQSAAVHAKKDEDDTILKKRKVQSKPSPRTEMVKWLKEFKEESKQREVQRTVLEERHHQENQEMLKQIMDIIKTRKD